MTSKNEQPETGFTQSYAALEEIVEQFKGGSLSLEDSLVLFETGVGHVKICQEKLVRARGRVEELVKTLQAGGESVTRPFEESL